MHSLSSSLSKITFSPSPSSPASMLNSRPDSTRPSFSSNPERSAASDTAAEREPFARTLQNQIDQRPAENSPRLPDSARADSARRDSVRSESARERANRTNARDTNAREASGQPPAQAAREPAREAESANPQARSGNADGTNANAASDAPPSTTHPAAESAAGADVRVATAGVDADALARLSATADTNEAGTNEPSDPARLAAPPDAALLAGAADAAAVAGLPAAFAALNQAIADTAAPEGDPLLEGSQQKASADPSLLPGKGDGKSAGSKADAGGLAAAALQARPVATAALAERFAAAPAGAALADDGSARALSAGTASPVHGAHAFSVLRQLPGTPAATPQLPVHTPASAQTWAADVGNQVRWMLGRAESKAELVLTPPNLGKLEVSITLSGDQTTAHFVASSQAARDALEQALPRLREMLQQAGIQLDQANVSTSGDQPAQGESSGDGRSGHYGGSDGPIADADNESSPAQWLRKHDGMVDTFA